MWRNEMTDNKKLVLIVDDNPVNIQVVGENLRECGIDISIATNGPKALSIAKNRKPDLILLDIIMPEMDGFAVCEKLKNDPETEEIPIIFLTAKNDEDNILKGFRYGAVDYITKPFRIEELKARVNTQLNMNLLRERLTNQKIVLEKLNRDKNELLGIAAHDLKNPIYSISMIAKVLRDDNSLNLEDVKEFSRDIITSADRMLELITQLLDINAIEDGKVKIAIENSDVNEVLQSVLSLYSDRAAAKKIQIHYARRVTDSFALFDSNALKQVLDNLISNAIKFSPFEKNVFVELSDNGKYKQIAITDEGPGMTEDDKRKLFGKFVKLSARPTADENSTGLGLSIVKKYVDAMNGSIRCESEYGHGASFILDLPAMVPA